MTPQERQLTDKLFEPLGEAGEQPSRHGCRAPDRGRNQAGAARRLALAQTALVQDETLRQKHIHVKPTK